MTIPRYLPKNLLWLLMACSQYGRAGTTGTLAIRALRLRVKFCLYSPSLRVWVHAVDVVHAVEGEPGAAHPDEAAGPQDLAVAVDVEGAARR